LGGIGASDRAERYLALALLSAVLSGLLLAAPGIASAEVDGNCDIFVDETSVAGLDSHDISDAIDIERDDELSLRVVAAAGAHHRAWLDVPGPRFMIVDEPSDSVEWSDTIALSDYSWAGVGLFRVIWESEFRDGRGCSAAVLMKVGGNPFTTLPGIVATGSLAAGVVGLGLTFTIGEGRRWALKLVGKAKVERDEERRRWRIRPSLAVTGTISGLLSAWGLLTLLQQGGVLWPSVEVVLVFAVPLGALGLAGSVGRFRSPSRLVAR
jgi:hypothetical protein